MAIIGLRRICAILATGALLLNFSGGAAADAYDTARPDGVLYSSAGEPGMPAIVLAHDWFGDTPYYREFGERLAGLGYSVIAVDLYEGKPGATTHAGAWELLKVLAAEHAASVLDLGVALAAKKSDTVLTIGFSAGAPHSLAAAVRHNEVVDGAVIFYGDPILEPEKLAQLGGPLLAIFGSDDKTYGKQSAADVAELLARAADEAAVHAEIHVYPGAAHAFAQPLFNAGKTYDPAAAEAAWKVTLEFLAHLQNQ